MKTRTTDLRCAACVVVLAAGLSAGAARATETVLAADCAPRLTMAQQRLFDRAALSTDALRQFVYIRRAMLQVDTYETAVWAEHLIALQAACTRSLASVAVTPASATASPGKAP